MKRLLLLCICFFSLSISFGQNVKDMEQRGKVIQEEIDRLQKLILTTAGDIKGQVDKYRIAQRLLSGRRELVSQLDQELSLLSKDIATKNNQIKEIQEEKERLTGAYQRLLLQAYKHRDKQLWFMFVLSSNDFRQALRRWRYFRSYSQTMRSQVALIKTVQAQLEEEEAQLKVLYGQRLTLRQKRSDEVQRIQNDQLALDGDIKKLRQSEKQLKTELQNRQKEQKQLEDQIRKAIASANKKAASASPQAIAEALVLSADFAKNKGKLPWPLDNAIVLEPFGTIVDRQWGFKFDNKGVTLSGAKGAQVKAIFNGVVTSVWVDNRDSYLIRVLINHGEYNSIYCHMVDVTVKEGDKVSTGQTLGTLAANGEGICYFQLLFKGKPLNPASWCTRSLGSVRK